MIYRVLNEDGTITNDGNGRCLEIANSDINSGANVWQWQCDGGLNQYWYGDFLPGKQLSLFYVQKHDLTNT